ncbi:glycoside hydrolase family 125 protein [Oidiodendron maius Zn]|uniref:Glycoside hydrolase family 125 protein n=1 Tax=Oidiodendron maius (strain Zn) TaxID=913774 RepID=A0A0C3GVT5_OIDMZ|nr:glycoside hydrolase family 125 protein [Oidiodendron maius Zn]
MRLSSLELSAIWLACSALVSSAGSKAKADDHHIKKACPDYKQYSTFRHRPFSDGPLQLPFQRPSTLCRTFSSPLVEKVIDEVTGKMVDKDLARLFENAFPNTLDTTVRWHDDGTIKHTELKVRTNARDTGKWEGAQSFVVTGDINAEWLRDSTNQLLQYQPLVKSDLTIQTLILGAINTQAEYVISAPYCNAFQPPPNSKLPATQNGQDDTVHPIYEPSFVFECKYELDSLAAFLSLGNTFYNYSKSLDFLTPRWYLALDTLLTVLDQQSKSTFDPVTGRFEKNRYTFSRQTTQGTETLPLSGIGNPLNYGTGLIRSAFRPSDDATIFGFLIPANAMMAVELKRTSEILFKAKKDRLAKDVEERARIIKEGIWEHGVVEHKRFGKVFAYEVDGYGGHILMDDANVPSLLALPTMGFVENSDPVYINTRKMILSKAGNPYYLEGKAFHGIGGKYLRPHIGPEYAWPMSLLVQAMTSDNDTEILECIDLVLQASPRGLVHESINVSAINSYTRSWFAWANSVFAQLILDLAKRKPHLIFGEGAEPYVIE